eukprot:1139264-Ditylum_brightwellii.AAC.1
MKEEAGDADSKASKKGVDCQVTSSYGCTILVMFCPHASVLYDYEGYHNNIKLYTSNNEVTDILNLKGEPGDADVKEGKRGVDC